MRNRILMAVAFLAILGCSSTPQGAVETSREHTALSELASVLPALHKPPARLADLEMYRSTHSIAYDAVAKGQVVVVWGARMPGEGDVGKGTTDVVAYEKATATDGGYVLLHNGNVLKMSAAEFQAAKKAK